VVSVDPWCRSNARSNTELIMNSKIDQDPDKNGKPVSLKLVLGKDINKLNSISDEAFLNADKSIHTIRKSLKSISAILLLCEVHFDREQYMSWKSDIRSLSRQYGALRAPYVYLQTFKQIEEKLKSFDNSNLYELRYDLELQYNLIVNDIKNTKETIQQGKESILRLTEELSNLDVNFKHKPLKRKLMINFQKSQRLFKELNLTSSAEEYHRFRKWCKIFYHQRLVLNQIKSEKTSKNDKKLYKLTEFLGNEHDLQLFYQYLSTHFPELSQLSEALFRLKIKRLRKKALALYPKISC